LLKDGLVRGKPGGSKIQEGAKEKKRESRTEGRYSECYEKEKNDGGGEGRDLIDQAAKI